MPTFVLEKLRIWERRGLCVGERDAYTISDKGEWKLRWSIEGSYLAIGRFLKVPAVSKDVI